MGLKLVDMARQNRFLTTLPQIVKVKDGAAPATATTQGFLAQKRGEEKVRLEQEIEVEERRKFLSELKGEDAKGSVRTFLVNPDAEEGEEFQELATGKPVVFRVEKPGGSGFNIDLTDIIGAAIERGLKPPEPSKGADATTVVAPPKTWIVNPLATDPAQAVQESEAGKPVVLLVGQAPSGDNNRQPLGIVEQIQKGVETLLAIEGLKPMLRGFLGVPPDSSTGEVSKAPVFQMADKAGNPLVLDIDNFIRLSEFTGEQKRKEEMHDEVKGLVKAAREYTPKIVGALDRMMKGTGKGTSELIEVVCKGEGCGHRMKIAQGQEQFICPVCQEVNEAKW